MILREHEGGPELEDLPPLRAPAPAPRTVAIVAGGPTHWDWHAAHFTYEAAIPPVDQVWTLNKVSRTCRADLVFVMDDLVGEARRCPQYAQDLRALGVPIITSTVDAEVRRLFPDADLHEYPIERVVWTLGMKVMLTRGAPIAAVLERPDLVHRHGMEGFYYLHNSVPFMLAYALVLNVKGVQLWGADYTFPGTDAREDDRANCEFWVGALRMAGVEVKVCDRSTLLNAARQPWLYGYGARPPVIRVPTQPQLEELLG